MKKMSTSLLALLLSFAIFHVSNGENDSTNEKGNQMIHVELNFGTFCPMSIWFIQEHLWPTYWALYPLHIIKLDLYTLGRVEERKAANGDYLFYCQHGEYECQVNIVETCYQHIYENKTQDEKLAFAYCATHDPSMLTAEKCAKVYGLDWADIFECYNGSLGKELQHELGVKLGYTEDKGMYGYIPMVPHVKINGKYSFDNYMNFEDQICSLIEPKPEFCVEHEAKKSRRRREDDYDDDDDDDDYW